MDPNVKAIVVLAAVIVVGLAVAWMIFQRRRTETLQRRFGPE
jgi:NADH:ubiquinone oxidoreductase subunit H